MKALLTSIINHFRACEVRERIICASIWILVVGLVAYCLFVVLHYVISTWLLYMDVYGIPVDSTGGDIWRMYGW